MRVIDEYPTLNPFNDVEAGSARILGWISGGVASAVACKLAIDHYGDCVELVFCDTHAENPDTMRFLHDLEMYFKKPIVRIHSEKYHDPEAVWRRYNGLNFAHGAPCSSDLKREVRKKHQSLKTDFAHIFGFDYDPKEVRRAKNMLANNPDLNPIFPLVVEKLDREMIFAELIKMKIEPPETYKYFLNNNCIGAFDSPRGGCVQGGIGYWQKMKRIFPKKFEYMADIELELSLKKGKPVTICKNQKKGSNGNRLFLKGHREFPEIESIDVVKGRQPVTMFECNGFCSTEEDNSHEGAE